MNSAMQDIYAPLSKSKLTEYSNQNYQVLFVFSSSPESAPANLFSIRLPTSR
jgi:hypothetical protein